MAMATKETPVLKYVFTCDATDCKTRSAEVVTPGHPDGWCVAKVCTFKMGKGVRDIGFDLCPGCTAKMLELLGPANYSARYDKS